MLKCLLAATAAMLCLSAHAADGLAAASNASSSCQGTRWVAAWRSSPTDGVTPGDNSLVPLFVGPSQTFRSMLSPTGTGTFVRVQISNRFGLLPLVITAATIAKQASGAAVDPSSLATLHFSGLRSVTVPAGADLLSDPVLLPFGRFETLAVSLSTSSVLLAPTHHFLARQRSYATLPGVGDRTRDASGDAFIQVTTTRPLVIGIDTLAPAATGTVVTFGDSLTDGDQQRNVIKALTHLQIPTQDTATIDLNQRYPDYLARRLAAANRPLFVANAGIGGNLVRQNSLIPFGGPSALSRVDQDVLAVPGTTDVIFWEGINDIGQTPFLTTRQLTDAYTALIDRFHAAGLNVIQGTLTPSGTALLPTYRTPRALTLRREVNEWIRTRSPADAIVDFDAVVRSAADPDRIDARYDGGDGLHFNAAGYQRLAEAVNLATLRGRACTP